MSAEGFWGAEEKYEAANKATACGGERERQRERGEWARQRCIGFYFYRDESLYPCAVMNDFPRVTENKVPLQENHGKKKPIIKTIIKNKYSNSWGRHTCKCMLA